MNRSLAIAVLVLAVFFGLIVPLFVRREPDVEGSVASVEPEGRRALFLTLQELGFEPEAWHYAPGRLPRGEHVLWCALAPTSFEQRLAAASEEQTDSTDANEDALEPELEDPSADLAPADRQRPLPLELHALEQYRDFVEAGGTLILPAGTDAAAFLTEIGREDLAPYAELESARIDFVVAPTGEQLVVDWPDLALLAPVELAAAVDIEELVVGPDGERIAVALPLGRGRIVLLADSAFVANGDVDNAPLGEASGLGRLDHDVLAVRLVEALDRGGRLFFDEYSLGLWRPETALGLATSGPRGWVLLMLVLLLAVLVWRTVWVREFPRDPESLEIVSSLGRARAEGSLYERARRFDLLASTLRRGVAERLCRRVGRRPPRGAAGALEPLFELLSPVARDAAQREEWRRAFLGPEPGDAQGLEALGAELSAIEHEIERGIESRRAAVRPSGIVRDRRTAAAGGVGQSANL